MGIQQNALLETQFQLCTDIQCLHCGELLHIDVNNHQSLTCSKCDDHYPILQIGDVKLPLIFEDIDAILFGWFARLNGFKDKLDQEIIELAAQSKNKKNSQLSSKRLKKILSAKKEFKIQISTLLECFDNPQATDRLITNSSLAKNQGIDSYINNIFRDWCWDNGENAEQLNAIEQVLPNDYQAGKTLTLGSGGSRLSYDFHYAFNANYSVLTDINPVLLGVAANIISNKSIELVEFPIGPLSLDDFAIKHDCQLAQHDNHEVDKFEFMLADALNLPFIKNSFDTILTPWFIDIIPIDFRDFIPHVNQMLKVGGKWVNSGSIAFFHKNPTWNYSQEEIIDLLKKFGFDEIKFDRTEINYLNSPYSSHGRRENIFSFSATKKFNSKQPDKFNYTSEWMRDLDKHVPAQEQFTAMSSKYLLQAQILSAVDGNRSISEISRLIAKQYEIPEEQARAAVRQIFEDNLEQRN